LVWGLAATRRSVCIYQMNRVHSRSDHGHEDITINIVVELLLLARQASGRQADVMPLLLSFLFFLSSFFLAIA